MFHGCRIRTVLAQKWHIWMKHVKTRFLIAGCPSVHDFTLSLSLFLFIHETGVEPSPLLLQLFTGLLYQYWMLDGDDCGAMTYVTPCCLVEAHQRIGGAYCHQCRGRGGRMNNNLPKHRDEDIFQTEISLHFRISLQIPFLTNIFMKGKTYFLES
jgi:hypothetical protein